jgi:hypothetical protein
MYDFMEHQFNEIAREEYENNIQVGFCFHIAVNLQMIQKGFITSVIKGLVKNSRIIHMLPGLNPPFY